MSFRRRSKNPDTGIWPFRNRMEGIQCAHCGKVITGSEDRPGEVKAWERTHGRSKNYHMACAIALGKIVNRKAYEEILEKNPDLERVELPPTAPESHPEPPVDIDDPEISEPEEEEELPEPAPRPKLPDWLQGMADAFFPYIEERVNEAIKRDAPVNQAEVEKIARKIFESLPKSNVTRVEVIDRAKQQPPRDLGMQHKLFPKLFSAVQARCHSGKRNMVMLVGPTGSGKTTACEKVAEALKVEYFHFGAMDSEYKMLGFVDAQGRIVSTEFRRWWNDGGLALFDEMDSWFPQAQLALNSVTNGYVTFPDGKQAGHPNRYLIAACNTWGLGGDNDYVGRFKLDAAFLNRWNVQMKWDYDEEFERAIFPHPWTRRVQEIRARARAKGIKQIFSPRASDSGPGLLADGWPQEEVEEVCLKQAMKDSDWASIALPRTMAVAA